MQINGDFTEQNLWSNIFTLRGNPGYVLPPLTDAYRFTPDSDTTGPRGAWSRIADMPGAGFAATSPAPALGSGHLVIAGGVNARCAAVTDPTDYPPFPGDVPAYHVASDTWTTLAQMPEGSPQVTVPTAHWHDRWVIPSGECRPGVRSNKVYILGLASGDM